MHFADRLAFMARELGCVDAAGEPIWEKLDAKCGLARGSLAAARRRARQSADDSPRFKAPTRKAIESTGFSANWLETGTEPIRLGEMPQSSNSQELGQLEALRIVRRLAHRAEMKLLKRGHDREHVRSAVRDALLSASAIEDETDLTTAALELLLGRKSE